MPTPTLLNSITIRVSPRERGLGVGLCFEMSDGADFTYMVFTDAKGIAELASEEFLAAFDADRTAAPDDFADPREAFTGEIYAKVLEPNELRAAYKSFSLFQRELRFPPNYETNLKDALIRGIGTGEFKIEIERL